MLGNAPFRRWTVLIALISTLAVSASGVASDEVPDPNTPEAANVPDESEYTHLLKNFTRKPIRSRRTLHPSVLHGRPF